MKASNTIECAPTQESKARNTFGIVGHTDIISAHLQARYISMDDFEKGYITESADRRKPYKLLLDYKTEKALKDNKEAAALVSFQVRKDGCYAVARLWKDCQKREILSCQ